MVAAEGARVAVAKEGMVMVVSAMVAGARGLRWRLSTPSSCARSARV
jgi:hypothetical protein